MPTSDDVTTQSHCLCYFMRNQLYIKQRSKTGFCPFKISKQTCAKGQPFDSTTITTTTTIKQQTMASTKAQNCRRKLQDKFERSENASTSTTSTGGSSLNSVLSSITLDETRKVLRNGGERMSKVFSSFRTSFGSFSQVINMF